MAKALLSMGGSEKAEVEAVTMDGPFVAVHLSTGKKVMLSPGEGARRIEQEDEAVIDYFKNPACPLVKFFRSDEVVHWESVPAGNIKSIVVGLF